MTGYGSVFLGDVQRHRILSTSTPPSSPPPTLSPSATSFSFSFNNRSVEEEIGIDDIENAMEGNQSGDGSMNRHEEAVVLKVNDDLIAVTEDSGKGAPEIPPALSLDLRMRWLETLLYGTKPGASAALTKERGNGTLLRGVEDLQRRLDAIVHTSDGLRRFMEHYEQHAHLLTPSFALSSSSTSTAIPPPHTSLAPSELEAFLAEMEADIRSADRDLREVEMLEKKDVTAAGKLPDYEPLVGRLDALVKRHEEDARLAREVEEKVARLMHRYASNVDTLSELFVAWDDGIQEAENEVARLTRDMEERKRLGYE
ncbi:hypothetical protein EUX98_g2141 [Antrodiella citrinella]|uniref:Uncharacterized protein n=1 Tax=Antrodiella citrinella TaxID=2447956 RepID=A0A4S4N7Z4_9APHY|nr:hypothetical protein EUX98_g2141 [Antrodiella citrinella]